MFCKSIVCQDAGYPCAYDIFSDELYKDTPSALDYLNVIEKSYKIHNKTSTRNDDELVLPIIVHVIHNGGVEDISDIQVFQAIDWLNESFANEGTYFNEEGIDTKIRFCLAQRDTLGNEINGIERHVSPLTDMAIHNSNKLISQLSALDPNAYINIRVVNTVCIGENCNLGGYAVNALSGAQSYRNGIVMKHDYFGTNEHRNKVLTHEMGHFLGLLHTFHKGCKNEDCLTDGDRVCDTPPDNNVLFSNCGLTVNSCTTDEDDTSENNPYRQVSVGGLGDQEDMIANYMDYSRTVCQDRFTQGQADRMSWFINQRHRTLLESQSCELPCSMEFSTTYPDISWDLPTTDTINIGDDITFDVSLNDGDSIVWFINSLYASSDVPFLYSPVNTGYDIISTQLISGEAGCDDFLYALDTIYAICTAFPDFIFFTDSAAIYFESTSIDASTISWQVFANGSGIYNSQEVIDTLDSLVPGSYTLCITASDGLCQDTYCQQLEIYGAGVEICSNSFDDDQDGYIDYFDEDCPCDNDFFQAQCPHDCEIIPDSFPEFSIRLKWQSSYIDTIDPYPANLVAGDITNDGNIELFTFDRYPRVNQNDPELQTNIFLINGSNGGISIKTQFSVTGKSYAISPPSIGDLDSDGQVEIVEATADSLYIFNSDLTIKSAESIDDLGLTRTPRINLVDINSDGISEIIVNTSIYNLFGIKLLELPFAGCGNEGIFGCFSFNSCVGDFDSDQMIEIASGNKIFEIEITNLSGTSGNSYSVTNANTEVKDGSTAIGDVNMDGTIDIIALRGTTFDSAGIYVWDPLSGDLIAKGEMLEKHGIPFVADINNDCNIEIGLVFEDLLRVYTYNGTTELQILFELEVFESSRSRIAVFDFNSDSVLELVYRDEEYFYIIDGANGSILYQQLMKSTTFEEIPLIVDVDNDGEVEIIVNGSVDSNSDDKLQVFCFESDGAPWAPARSVWNQYNYHVTNVNDDLTIPRYQQNMAAFFETDSCGVETCLQPYNGMFMQATYRDQNGCRVYPESNTDLQITADYTCVGDSIEICLYAISTDTSVVRQGVPVSCYPPPWDMTDVVLDQVIITEDTTCITYAIPSDIDSIMIVINDDGGFYPPSLPNTDIQECDYTNNTFVLHLEHEELTLDLGPDILRCATEPVVLLAQSGFASYLWNDFTTDSIYTAADDGLHFIETMDACGRIYMDTVRIETDTTSQLVLNSSSLLVCPRDTISVESNLLADSIIWQLDGVEVDCINCNAINIVLDSSTIVSALSIKDNCLSVDSLLIEVRESYVDSLLFEICENDTLAVYNMEIFEEGHYEYRVDDCDTIINIEVTTIPIKSSMFTDTLCFGDTLFIEGETFTESGTYLLELQAQNGCDSLLTLDLYTRDSIITMDTYQICEGDSVTIDNVDYFSDSTVQVISISEDGCDSISLIEIFLVEEFRDTSFARICMGDSLEIFNDWENESGTYSLGYTSSSGCDSTSVIILSVDSTYNTTIDSSICENDTIEFGSYEIFASGSYYDTLLSTLTGCDSLVELTVTLYPIYIDTVFESICEGDSIELNGDIFKEQGIYTFDLGSYQGCDSLMSLSLSVLPLDTITQTMQLCEGDSILISDNYYYKDTLLVLDTLNSNGCDSITEVTISTVEELRDTSYQTVCEGDSIEIFNIWRSEEGSYSFGYISPDGCDSISIVILDVDSVVSTTIDTSLCEGDSLSVGDSTFTVSGVYQVPLTSVIGCDSIVNLDLEILPTQTDSLNVQLCQGDTFAIEQTIFTSDTSFTYSLSNSLGCDSLTFYHLSFNDFVVMDSVLNLCHGDTIIIDDQVITSSLMLSDTIAGNDCNEIYTYDVQFRWRDTIYTDQYMCIDDTIIINGMEIYGPTEVVTLVDSTSLCSDIEIIQVKLIDDISLLDLQQDTTIAFGADFNVVLSESNQWRVRKICSTLSELYGGLAGAGPNLSFDNMEQADTVMVMYITQGTGAGCVQYHTFIINVTPPDTEIDIPNIFSPNGDNINDFWGLDLSEYPENEISIYDRWGNLVANWKNANTITWDGTFNGQLLMAGVYLYTGYLIDADGNRITLVSDITILK